MKVNDSFEIKAAAFYKTTGVIAPGKAVLQRGFSARRKEENLERLDRSAWFNY